MLPQLLLAAEQVAVAREQLPLDALVDQVERLLDSARPKGRPEGPDDGDVLLLPGVPVAMGAG